jgi:hypothetical protein
MRIAYVTTYDASDVARWSGARLYIAQPLRDAGAQLDLVGPLEDPRPEDLPTVRVGWRFYGTLPKNRFGSFHSMHGPAVLRHYAAQVAKMLGGLQPDIVIGAGALPVAYPKTDPPIVFWSDATFAAMIDSHPGFSGLTSRTEQAGNGYEGSALRKAALAIYSSALEPRPA